MHFNLAGLPLLRAYTDETGDRGFTAKASPIFGITAVLVPDEHDAALRAVVERLRSDFGIVDAPLRWAKHCGPTRHDRRRHVARLLAALPGVQVIYVVIDKTCVPADAGMRDDNSLAFNFTAKLLFERIALSARDWPGGRRRAIVRVSHVKGHDHPEMLHYIREQSPR